jgi:hypothetical protein
MKDLIAPLQNQKTILDPKKNVSPAKSPQQKLDQTVKTVKQSEIGEDIDAQFDDDYQEDFF